MTEEQLKKEISEAKAEYFRAADSALEKINQKFGTGRAGFLDLLNNNAVENFSENHADKN